MSALDDKLQKIIYKHFGVYASEAILAQIKQAFDDELYTPLDGVVAREYWRKVFEKKPFENFLETKAIVDQVDKDVKQEADDLARDLIKIIKRNATGYTKKKLTKRVDLVSLPMVDLIQDLCIYIAFRDTKVLEHGINLGRKRQRELAGSSEDDRT